MLQTFQEKLRSVVPGLQPEGLPICLSSYRDEQTISRAGLPPAGYLRLRGVPICWGAVI